MEREYVAESGEGTGEWSMRYSPSVNYKPKPSECVCLRHRYSRTSEKITSREV